jgi:SAM-dependent methyltransferase
MNLPAPDATLYDEVPYPSVPFPQTHPDRLAVLATLFGMHPAPVERCRVLELGCGDGSNLIPMALGLPESRFLGIDLAGVPVARGREAIDVLGLRNVALRQEDLRAFAQRPDVEEGPFEYIVAHGVYSWVPDEVREAILAICRRHLAPQGVAYISYNAYPGCHVRLMVREMLLYHVGGTDDSGLAIARAQGIARLLGDVLPAIEDLTFLKSELRTAAERAPSVLLHDDLAPENRPFYFWEFAAQADAHGLQYLAEAHFPDMQAHSFSDAVVEILQAFEQERGLVAKEQYLDFLRVRRFRQTLLCHAELVLDRALTAGRIERFSVASPVTPASAEPDLRPGVAEEFRGPRDSVIRIDLPLAKAALLELGEAWPLRRSIPELAARAQARLVGLGLPAAEGDDQIGVLIEILFQTYAAGVIQLHTFMPALALEPGERPIASPLARLQARRHERPLVTTLLHTHLLVEDALGRHALQLLDGTRDRAALLADLRRWVREQGPAAATDAAPPVDISPVALEAKLRELARLGLLVG